MGRMNNKNYQVVFAQLLKASKFETVDLLIILLGPLLKPVLLPEKCKGTNATPAFKKPSGALQGITDP